MSLLYSTFKDGCVGVYLSSLSHRILEEATSQGWKWRSKATAPTLPSFTSVFTLQMHLDLTPSITVNSLLHLSITFVQAIPASHSLSYDLTCTSWWETTAGCCLKVCSGISPPECKSWPCTFHLSFFGQVLQPESLSLPLYKRRLVKSTRLIGPEVELPHIKGFRTASGTVKPRKC